MFHIRTKTQADAAVNAFVETLTDVLKAGDKITLKGLPGNGDYARELENIDQLLKADGHGSELISYPA
mgnify:CR=1 FL=1